MPHQLVVSVPPDHFDEFGSVGDIDRCRADVRLGVAAAVPVEVVSAGSPATAVVLADGYLCVRRTVWKLDVAVGTPDWQLPAHVRLRLERVHANAQGKAVQSTSRTSLEPGTVQEDARTFVQGGLAVAVVVGLDPAFPVADIVELPLVRAELLGVLLHALLVVLVGEVRPEAAATVVRPVGVDALTALAEDTHPVRGQPGQVTLQDLGVDGRVGELDPGARKDKINLRHAATLRRRVAYC